MVKTILIALDEIEFDFDDNYNLLNSLPVRLNQNSVLKLQGMLEQVMQHVHSINAAQELSLDAHLFLKKLDRKVKMIMLGVNSVGKSMLNKAFLKTSLIDVQFLTCMTLGSSMFKAGLEDLQVLSDYVEKYLRFFHHLSLANVDISDRMATKSLLFNEGFEGFSLGIPRGGLSAFKSSTLDVICQLSYLHEKMAGTDLEEKVENTYLSILNVLDVFDLKSGYVFTEIESFISLLTIARLHVTQLVGIAQGLQFREKNDENFKSLKPKMELELYISKSCKLCKILLESEFFQDLSQVLLILNIPMIIHSDHVPRMKWYRIDRVPTFKFLNNLMHGLPITRDLDRGSEGYKHLFQQLQSMLNVNLTGVLNLLLNHSSYFKGKHEKMAMPAGDEKIDLPNFLEQFNLRKKKRENTLREMLAP
ncbi:MAG: hypothetical protein ACTSVY_07395 [Candidatus Helarchaeota archaeon]